jgi:hypothetical protein
MIPAGAGPRNRATDLRMACGVTPQRIRQTFDLDQSRLRAAVMARRTQAPH